MAWRPSHYLIEGEIDNTEPGVVTGWLRFAGLDEPVKLQLEGNAHRDMRGAKLRLRGDAAHDGDEAAKYMEGFALQQIGDAGDITAGRPPADYVSYPYLEWYSQQNGRVVLELEPEQVELIGRPIPACESDPVDRGVQAQHMAGFLTDLSTSLGKTAVALPQGIVSDPTFSHWVVVDDQIIGEAREIEADADGAPLAYVRLFHCPEFAEYGTIEQKYLRSKRESASS